MSEAPERIWVEKSISESGNHGSTAWPDNDDTETDIEYVRADRIEELEAKLAKAVEDCANVAKRMADEALTPAAREHAEQIAEAIIAELNPDAR